MNHAIRAAIGAAIMLVASGAARAQDQDQPERRGRGASAIDAASDTLGLTDEQVDQIREIRRERPPRGQSREEFQTWNEGQKEKVEGVLNDDQKSKLAELTEAREQMRALAGAAALGLVQGNRGGPSPRVSRSRGNRGRPGFGPRGRQFGPDRGRRARGPDRWSGRGGPGFRSRGRGFSPSGRGPGRGRGARGDAQRPGWDGPGFRSGQRRVAQQARPGQQDRGRIARSGD